MRFDFTEGKTAKYRVSIVEPDRCNDQLLYHYIKDARAKMHDLAESGFYESGTVLRLYDIQKCVRKDTIIVE